MNKDTSINTTLLDTSFVLVTYDTTSKILAIIWKGKLTSEQYRHTYVKSLEFSEDHKVEGFMVDISKQKGVSSADKKWFDEQVLPNANTVGLKKACVVYDGNLFREYYLTHSVKRTKKYPIPYKYFKSRRLAMEWLLEGRE